MTMDIYIFSFCWCSVLLQSTTKREAGERLDEVGVSQSQPLVISYISSVIV